MSLILSITITYFFLFMVVLYEIYFDDKINFQEKKELFIIILISLLFGLVSILVFRHYIFIILFFLYFIQY